MHLAPRCADYELASAGGKSQYRLNLGARPKELATLKFSGHKVSLNAPDVYSKFEDPLLWVKTLQFNERI